MHLKILFRASYMAQWQRIHLPMQETQETRVPSLDQEDPLEEAQQPIQYSSLEKPMDRGAWWATVRGVTESDMNELLRMHTCQKYGWRPSSRC